jgi:hypothetical protein
LINPESKDITLNIAMKMILLMLPNSKSLLKQNLNVILEELYNTDHIQKSLGITRETPTLVPTPSQTSQIQAPVNPFEPQFQSSSSSSSSYQAPQQFQAPFNNGHQQYQNQFPNPFVPGPSGFNDLPRQFGNVTIESTN